jgi:hypothetical protein
MCADEGGYTHTHTHTERERERDRETERQTYTRPITEKTPLTDFRNCIADDVKYGELFATRDSKRRKRKGKPDPESDPDDDDDYCDISSLLKTRGEALASADGAGPAETDPGACSNADHTAA